MKDLIVHVDSAPQCAARIDLAARLAKRFEGRLSGVYAQHANVMPLGVEALQEMEAGTMSASERMQYATRLTRADAQAAEQAFRERVERHTLTAHWYTMAGSAADVVVAYARYADLAVVGQTPAGGEDVATEIALRAGRPVLVAPHAESFPLTMERVLIAWDASRESTRALHDALPLLRQASRVTVLSVGPAEKAPLDVDIARHLRLHGIEAAHVQEDDTESDAGRTVLARAEALSCDLIVMGAYGHSRLRERVLGGTTRHVLKHMAVPVLVAH